MMRPRFELTPAKTARRRGVFKLSDREKLQSQMLSQRLQDYIAPGIRRDRWKREMDMGDPTGAMEALAQARMQAGLPPLDVFPITMEV